MSLLYNKTSAAAAPFAVRHLLRESLRSKFDAIFLIDVLEHISGEEGFLAALLFHLAENGKLVLDVPAG
jgi:2-polyprenyl-3-methyl-5-hydroxy-6-metoxy-1,4-benzoquinol methylase